MDSQDQQTESKQGAATAPAIPSAQPAQPPQKSADELLQEMRDLLEAERLTNIELRAQVEQQKNQSAVERAAQAARNPGDGSMNGRMQDMVRAKAVQAAGGPALFQKLPLDQRLAAQGQHRPATPEEIQRAQLLFDGKHALDAARLAAASPQTYARLRVIWIETSN